MRILWDESLEIGYLKNKKILLDGVFFGYYFEEGRRLRLRGLGWGLRRGVV